MTGGTPRRGRRDNGLHAASYVRIADVDPRVGEHLLDVLGLAGIAAYLQPATDLHPVTRANTLPSRHTERLFADRDHLTEARDYVARLARDAAPGIAGATPGPTSVQPPVRPAGRPPEPTDRAEGRPAEPRRGAEPDGPDDPTAPPPGSDPTGAGPTGPTGTGPSDPTGPITELDAAWARIVADFDAPVSSPVPPWPVAEDLPDDEKDADEKPGTGPGRAPAVPDAIDPFAATGRPAPPAEEELDPEDRFEPPPPPPIPRPSRYTALALGSIAGGLVLLFWPGVLDVTGLDESITVTVGVLLILVGFGTLVWRLRAGDDEEDDDTDDGARV